MRYHTWLVTAVIGTFLVSGCSKSAPEATPEPIAKAPPAPDMGTMPGGGLTSLLGSKFGLTTDQASGAVGSILSYAKGKLPAADFDKVAATIPSSASDMKAAQAAGAVAAPNSGAMGLTSALGKLGISPAVAGQVLPVVTEYVGKVGGPQVGQLLAGIM